MDASTVIKIEKFLGLNTSDGSDTNLKLGELSTCDNIRIIENYKARRRYGYSQVKKLGTTQINHIAKLGTKYIVAVGTHLLEIDESEIES
jgi:hypothetical protein